MASPTTSLDPVKAQEAIESTLNKRLDQNWTTAIRGRPLREARWFRNVRFQSGEHWIYINPTSYRVEPRPLPTPDFPRAVTNKFAQINNDLVSSLIGQSVPLNPRPSTDDPEDRGSAEIADMFSSVIQEETGWDGFEETLANWITLTGNAFLIPWYDYDEKWGTRPVNFLVCPKCQGEWAEGSPEVTDGMCPVCSPATQEAAPPPVPLEGEAIAPPVGVPLEPVVKDMPIGRLRTDVCSPFEILWDNRIPIPESHSWFFRRFRISVEDAKKKWSKQADKIKENMPEMQPPSNVNYMEALSYVGTRNIPSSGEASKTVQGVVFYEEPCPDYPNGLRVVRLGKDLIVEVEELKTFVGAGQQAGQRFLPLVHFYGDVLPGSAWGKPRADDLVHMQHRRNIIESALQLTAQRTGTPKLLVPENSGIKNVTGQAGQVFYNYRPYLLGANTVVEPKYLESALGNVSPLVALLQVIDDGMEKVAGTNFLAGGDTPPGVTAACLDEESSECLTKSGWKRASDVLDTDEIYTLNPDTNLGQWSPVLRVNRYDYRGRVITMNNNQVSATMTPNHAWYVGDCNKLYAKKGKSYKRVQTTKLTKSQYLPLSAPLNAVSAGGNFNDDFVRFVGWLVTEGSYYKRAAGAIRNDKRGRWTSRTDEWSVEISQSAKVNGSECAAIRSCLSGAGLRFRESVDKRTDVVRFRIFGKLASTIVEQFPDKRLTNEFIHSLSQSQLKILVDTMMLGDGHEVTYRKDGSKHHTRVFNSADRKLFDQFMMVATLAGYPIAEIKPYFNTDRHKSERYSDTMFRCSIKATPHAKLRMIIPTMKEMEFSGRVWCPTTETGTWLARSNGKVFVTGNSALALLDERAIRSISPLKRKWARGKKNWLIMCLEIVRLHWTDERMLVTVGRNKEWQVEKFKGADLKGSVDIRVDYEALMPKSKAREAADVQLVTQLGIINPADPETSYAALEIFGLTRLMGSVDEAINQAQREFDRFLNERKAPLILPGVQNSPVHLIQHRKDAQTQEMELLRETDPQWAKVWDDHVLLTMADVMAAQAAMAPSAGVNPETSQGGSLEAASTTGKDKMSTPEKKGRGAVAANRGEQAPPSAGAEPSMTGANKKR